MLPSSKQTKQMGSGWFSSAKEFLLSDAFILQTLYLWGLNFICGCCREMERTYKIHDNGGRPFHVKVRDNHIEIWKNMDTYEKVDGKFVDIPKEPKKLFDWTVDEIYIGKKSPKGGYDGLKSSQAVGNSILLKKGSKYIFVGQEIYEFTPKDGDTIEKYYSDIGNNDVPYPYAIGKKYIYLMIENVAVERGLFDMKEDIYGQYYGSTHHIEMCLKGAHYDTSICKDRDAAREKMADWKKRTFKIKKKVLEKRN